MTMQRYISIICILAIMSCVHNYDNPSDPKTESHTEQSHAILERTDQRKIIAGDAVPIRGGVSSDAVDEAELVTAYHWDYDGDGQIDTVLRETATLNIRFNHPGEYDVHILLEDKAGFSDSASLTIEVLAPTPEPLMCTLNAARMGMEDIYAGDSVTLFALLQCDSPIPDTLDIRYYWDTDGDGEIDKLRRNDTFQIVFDNVGTTIMEVEAMAGDVFLDSDRFSLEVLAPSKPTAYTCTLTPVSEMANPIRAGDTVTVNGSIRCVNADPDTLQLQYHWDTDGDGNPDTLTENTSLIRVAYPEPGVYPLNVTLWGSEYILDSAGLFLSVIARDSIPVDTVPPPAEGTHLPDFPNLPGFPDVDEGGCAFYAEDSAMMKTVLNFYNIMWEQTRSDGLQAIEFIEKLLLDILGYSLITFINDDYRYTFDNGVYMFSADSLRIGCAFHYGESTGSHAENDTIRHNLFSTASYVSGIKTTLSPPFFSFNEGPLFDLLEDDLSVDNSLNVSYTVNLTKIKISFLRKTQYTFEAIPFPVLNENIPLNTTHTSYARLAPVYCKHFGTLFHEDSLLIDHGGTQMSSSASPLDVIFKSDDQYKKANYLFNISQVMDSQKTAYGDRDGVLKLSGEYNAKAAIGFNQVTKSIYFIGRYSSTVHDSSWFYCDSDHTNPFGTLFFDDTGGKTGRFRSETYDYSFFYKPPEWELWRYRTLIE